MDKTNNVLIIITFVLVILAGLAFSFGLIPQDQLDYINNILNTNLDQFLNNETAITATSLALTSGSASAFRSLIKRTTNKTDIQISNLRELQAKEVQNLNNNSNQMLEELKKKSEQEIELKKEELKLKTKEIDLAKEQLKAEKEKVKTIQNKKYW